MTWKDIQHSIITPQKAIPLEEKDYGNVYIEGKGLGYCPFQLPERSYVTLKNSTVLSHFFYKKLELDIAKWLLSEQCGCDVGVTKTRVHQIKLKHTAHRCSRSCLSN